MPDKKANASALKENLTDLIIKHLNTGEKLPSEKEMMQQFGVSRTTLREVLYAYEANGILTSRQGSGYYVQTPDISKQIMETWSILLHANPSLLLDLLEIRTILEINILPKAIEHVTTEQLQYMGQQVEIMKQKAYQGENFVTEDREFHRTLFISTGNLFLEQLLTTFWDLFEKTGTNKNHDKLVNSALQHEAMLKALARQDFDRLTELLKQQFDDSRYQIVKSLINL